MQRMLASLSWPPGSGGGTCSPGQCRHRGGSSTVPTGAMRKGGRGTPPAPGLSRAAPSENWHLEARENMGWAPRGSTLNPVQIVWRANFSEFSSFA